MYIEERAINLAHYIIDSKDTVRGAAKKFGISKSTVHTEVTFQNGRKKSHIIPKSIENKNPPAKRRYFTYNAHRAMLQAEPQGS